MKYFDEVLTEEEIEEIQKKDNLYTKDTISLNDKKNSKLLDSYAYQQYLRKKNKKKSNNNKGGAF